jgi:hypothetical protein
MAGLFLCETEAVAPPRDVEGPRAVEASGVAS